MEFDEKTQKEINRLGTMMICYELVLVCLCFMRTPDMFDFIMLAINAINFFTFQFVFHDNKKLSCIFSIVIGFLSIFLLRGFLILFFGLSLAITGITTLSKINKFIKNNNNSNYSYDDNTFNDGYNDYRDNNNNNNNYY